MQLGKLDHVNVRTTNLDAMKTWYEEILGMRSGNRPPFPFPGAWMYAGEHACVHLVSVDRELESVADLKLEHFAFQATGLASFKRQLEAAGERYEERPVPGAGIVQINIWDPDGNHIHVDFSGGDVAGILSGQ